MESNWVQLLKFQQCESHSSKSKDVLLEYYFEYSSKSL